MKTVMGLTNHPNFKQTIIMIDNQIVYTIAKKLQWCYSGKCKRMFMLRPLRIEMVFINLIGDIYLIGQIYSTKLISVRLKELKVFWLVIM